MHVKTECVQLPFRDFKGGDQGLLRLRGRNQRRRLRDAGQGAMNGVLEKFLNIWSLSLGFGCTSVEGSSALVMDLEINSRFGERGVFKCTSRYIAVPSQRYLELDMDTHHDS